MRRQNESQSFINDNKDDNISETINLLNEEALSYEDLELQYEIEAIREDLLEMKKFMNDMSNIKPGSEINTFTCIKRIGDLKVRYQRDLPVSSDELNYYLVTEWMENSNLREYYKNHKLDWNKKFEFAIDICQGIVYLDTVDILHHDIRGTNILINRNHRVKIANFGLSRKFGDIARDIQVNLENMRYMAPEKLEYGALLWEIAEEEIPYTRLGIDLQTIRDRVVKEKYPLYHDPDFRPTIAKIFSVLYDYHRKDEKKEILLVGDEFEDDFILVDEMMSVDQAIEEHRKPNGNKQKAWESFKYHAELENRQANLSYAAILFKEAADCGKVGAQLLYGFCMWRGDGVPVNWDEAMRYLKLADDNGNPTAMYNVGSAYWIGKGVVKDQEIGSKYLRMAAKKDQHNAIAICKKLGISY
ncbi:kinase-like protein [Gigaspora margarita]|uniref:Kinase-like protein n=1 Tax=Gigaspora margarita TaxID=4874 RepID=A0A8H4EN97_GIGMA|nr:kinase-like protein [Gigaspora margarita]